MLRIAHIADVHVRGLSRHDEYREVFTAFVKQCKQREVQHIFVGGDLFHTKTSGLSPEYIDFMSWWLNTMAEAAEVHLTLGNHDGNLVNMSRQDAISPIVDALHNPRVHLYKKSGVYEFAPGYNWCIFSLFDEDGWDDVKPVQGKVNITCYHGPVWGAVTETDWLIEEGLTVDFFKKFDFCLLGDIHKTQYLSSRAVELVIDEADLSKYPGAEVIA
jgi:DNA repair exonuclease SbcCD nuclease subunit